MIANSIAQMAHTTLALIFACVLGVSGGMDSVTIMPDTIVFRTTQFVGMGFGGLVFLRHDYPAWTIDHERGHLRQENQLGILYIPIVGISSIINHLRSRAGTIENYYGHWPENWANRLGGVE